MTQVFDQNRLTPVTVIEAGPCRVVTVKTKERDGYEAVQLSFGEVKERKLSKAELGHLKKNQSPASRVLREFEKDGDPAVGQSVTVGMFKKGDWVDVTGISKGKVFRGWFVATTTPVARSLTDRCSTGIPVQSGQVHILRVCGRGRSCRVIWGRSRSRRND